MALNTINQQHFILICYYIETMAVFECSHLISFHNRTLSVTYYKGIAEKKEDIDRCLQNPHFRHHNHLEDEIWNWLQDSQRRMRSTDHEIIIKEVPTSKDMRDRRENMTPPAMRRLMIVFFIVPLRCSLVIVKRDLIC